MTHFVSKWPSTAQYPLRHIHEEVKTTVSSSVHFSTFNLAVVEEEGLLGVLHSGFQNGIFKDDIGAYRHIPRCPFSCCNWQQFQMTPCMLRSWDFIHLTSIGWCNQQSGRVLISRETKFHEIIWVAVGEAEKVSITCDDFAVDLVAHTSEGTGVLDGQVQVGSIANVIGLTVVHGIQRSQACAIAFDKSASLYCMYKRRPRAEASILHHGDPWGMQHKQPGQRCQHICPSVVPAVKLRRFNFLNRNDGGFPPTFNWAILIK